MLASTHKSRLEQMTEYRNKALLSALEAALKLANPDCDDVRIRPLAVDNQPEAEWRKDQAAYLNSWVIGPLADALRQTNLSGYADGATPLAAQFLEELDALPTR